MKKKNGKAFTIVELVIVIAVIAILLAVLVPTFSNIIKKAKISSDIQLCKNLNTIMATAELTDQKNQTMHKAVIDASDNGYRVGRLTPTSGAGYDILWDSITDRFGLWDQSANNGQGAFIYKDEAIKEIGEINIKDREQKATDFFVVQNAADPYDETKQFSSYIWLEDNRVVDSSWNGTTFTKGIDVGYVEALDNITYSRPESEPAQEVIIRTNNGTLTVDAPNDTVYHYGSATVVNIIRIAGKSYHEYGAIALVAVKEGHLALEKDSDVFGIHFVKSGETDARDNSSDTFNDIVLTIDGEVDFDNIEFSRDPVAINSTSGTKVCLVELNDESEYVYLFQQGIYEQIKVAPESNASNLQWVDTANVSEDTKDLSFQIANNLKGRTEFEQVSSIKPSINQTTRALNDTSDAEEAGKTTTAATQAMQSAFEKKYAPSVDVIDIVFVIDDSSSGKVADLDSKVVTMLNSIIKAFGTTKTINVGVVKFKGYAISPIKDSLNQDSMVSYSIEKEELITNAIAVKCPGNGSNIQSGIVKGMEILQNSTTPDKCKFMILFTDCKSYYWLNDKGEATTIYGYYSSQRQFNGIRTVAGLTGDALLPNVAQTAGIDKYNGYAIENSKGTPLKFAVGKDPDFMTLYNSTNDELLHPTKYDTVVDWSRSYGNPTGQVTIKTVTNPIRSGYVNLNEDYTYTRYMDYSINQEMNILELNPYEIIDNGDNTVSYDLEKDNPDYYAYHVCAWEKAIYKAAHSFADANEKYNCSVVGYVKDVTGWSTSQQGFKEWLINTADNYCEVSSNAENNFSNLLNSLKQQISDLAKVTID